MQLERQTPLVWHQLKLKDLFLPADRIWLLRPTLLGKSCRLPARLSVLEPAPHHKKIIDFLLFAAILFELICFCLALTNAGDNFAVTSGLEEFTPLLVPAFSRVCEYLGSFHRRSLQPGF